MDKTTYKEFARRFKRASDRDTIISTAREYFAAGGGPAEAVGEGTVFSLVLDTNDDALTDHVLSTFDGWSGFERQIATSAAISAGNEDVLRKLLDLGARVKLKKGYMPHIAAAAELNEFECVDVLLEHGASLDDRGPFDYTPLHWAASSGNEQAVHSLIDRGADPNALAKDAGKERTALQLAQERGHDGVVRLLLVQGEDISPELARELLSDPGRSAGSVASGPAAANRADGARAEAPVDWPMVIAFHAPIILLGIPAVMPAIFALLAAGGILGDDLSKGLLRLEYTQLLTLGAMSLIPSIFAYGTRLQFSGGRFLAAAAFIAFTSIQALATAMRSGSSLPISLGGGLLGVFVATMLGGAGLAIYNASRRSTDKGQGEVQQPEADGADRAEAKSPAVDLPHPLFAELVDIGRVPNNPDGVADELFFWRPAGEGVGPQELWDARTRAIGEELFAEGSNSLDLMLQAHEFVVDNLGGLAGTALSAHWHKIGEDGESGEIWNH